MTVWMVLLVMTGTIAFTAGARTGNEMVTPWRVRLPFINAPERYVEFEVIEPVDGRLSSVDDFVQTPGLLHHRELVGRLANAESFEWVRHLCAVRPSFQGAAIRFSSAVRSGDSYVVEDTQDFRCIEGALVGE